MIIPTILITAYKNPKQVNHLIDFFPNDVNIYIHFDAKHKNLVSQIIKKNNVFVFSIYSVNWGSFNHLQSILFLCNQAVRNNKNEYFHLISGEDYPCSFDFEAFQKILNYKKNYIEYFSLPFKGWLPNGGIERINKYHLNDIYDVRSKNDFRFMLRFQEVQYSVNVIQRKKFIEEFNLNLYGGSTWWSLSREALEYVLEFTSINKSFLYRFRYTFCSEEIYFQTVLLNNKLIRETIVNHNVRYIDWNSRNKNAVPCYLDKSDFLKISSSKKLFARKMVLENILKYKSFLSY